ncbi:MAG TPA: protein translocase subunit SecD [Verrucomicrobiota bacterium]|nr:protein translocase subunit SecD [Verrucomicrobiota bacterium]
MNPKLLWKFLLTVFIVLWSLWEMYPPTSRNLMDEFARRASNKDATFTAIMERAQALQKTNPSRTFGNLLEAIGTNQIAQYFPGVTVPQGEEPTRAILHKVQADASGKIKLGLDLQGGTSFLVAMDTNKISADMDHERVLAQAVEVLRKRVDKLGVAEPLIQPQGTDRILIQLPGLSEADNESARRQIQKAAFLEFRMVHPESDELISKGIPAPGYERLIERPRKDSPHAPATLLVKKKPERGLTGNNISRAMMIRNYITGEPEIHFELDSKGGDLFAQITRENLGQRMAIILDGELYSAPVIQSEIPGGRGQITGTFTDQEAVELANVLENPLEAPVKIIMEDRVDPCLGVDSIRSGVTASIIGALATVCFMLVFYFFVGFIANFALFLNVVILMGVMCQLQSTLTLPGIAGIALTIGMAVDANVLIYERLREELALGKSIRGAIVSGYSKAFGTIFDSNLTTLISAVILIYMGTGPVKGFGVTLTIGICASMFTAVLVTRLIFDFLHMKGWIKRVRMLPIIKFQNIDFLRWSKQAFVLSGVLIVVGVAYGLYQGKRTLGVDFAGGDALTLSFTQRVEVDRLRDAINKLNVGDPLIQYQRGLSEAGSRLRILTRFDTGTTVKEALIKEFPQAGFKELGIQKVGGAVGVAIQKSAVLATVLAMFGILLYVAMRYEFSFAVAAVLAVLHDVLITMGLFFIFGFQMSSTMIAGVLTIIGYSINDKIVILDRIREDLNLGSRGSFKDLINLALNQTLSRTMITGGSVMMATMALLIFGGGIIRDFAFTFLVGTIAGTYSSIFIASPVVLWWHKGQRPTLGTSQIAVEESAATAKV